eukprot:TRINITY_DN14194_c0_g1_i1.p1 TRINITY_DN14194_c0_g1~~TRINITY_DN14194_c0_g1_i1.p1  ORF type:complete len:1537 (-),score=283.07 TRINITY_DN14194_c0_g1_i1:44-4033(-)
MNLNVSLPHPSLLSDLTIVTQGIRTFTTFRDIEVSEPRVISRINYDSGCITTEPSSGASSPSARFVQQLQDYNLPSTSVSCFAYTHNIRGLSMTLSASAEVHITGLTEMAPLLEFTGGLVTLEDSEVWTNVTLDGRTLVVDDQRYQVTLYKSELTVSSEVWSTATKIDLSTSISAPYAKWFLGGEVETGLTWDGITSLGSLRFPNTSIPTVVFNGEGAEIVANFGSEKGIATFIPTSVEIFSNVSFTDTTFDIQGDGSLQIVDFDLWDAGKINLQGYHNAQTYFSMKPSYLQATGLKEVGVQHSGPFLELSSSFGRSAQFNMNLDTGLATLVNVDEVQTADFIHDEELVHTSFTGKSSGVTFDAEKGLISGDNIVRFFTTTKYTNHSLETTSIPSSAVVNYASGVIRLEGVLTLSTTINATEGLLKVESESVDPVRIETNLRTAYIYLGGTDLLSVQFDGNENQFQIDSVHTGTSTSEIKPQVGTAVLRGVEALNGKFNARDTNMVFKTQTRASNALIDLEEGRLEISSALNIDVAASGVIGTMTVVAFDSNPFPTIIAAKIGYVSVQRSEELVASFHSESVTIDVHSRATEDIAMRSELGLATGDILISGMRSLEYALDHPLENNTLTVEASGSGMILKGDMHEGLTDISRSEHVDLVKKYPHYQLHMNTTSVKQAMQVFSSRMYDMLKSASFAQADFVTNETSLSLVCEGNLYLVNITKDSDLEVLGEANFTGIKTTSKSVMEITSAQPSTGRLYITNNTVHIAQASRAELNMTVQDLGQILVSGTGNFMSADLDMDTGLMNFGGRGLIDVSMGIGSNSTNSTKRTELSRNISITEYEISISGNEPLAVKQASDDSNVLITSMSLTLRDGPNDVHVAGSLRPIINLDEGVGARIYSSSSATVLTFPNSELTFDVDQMALGLGAGEGKSCISPKQGCSLAAWTSLSGGKYSHSPCHSTFFPCDDSNSIELNFYGKVQCISPDHSVEGWEISTIVESIDEYDDLFRYSLKGFIIFVYTWDILMLLLGWVAFGSFLIEGWAAFAITAFLMKATPQSAQVSMVALNMVLEAYHVFVGWFMGEQCSLEGMRAGWALIAITLIIWIILVLERQKWLERQANLDVVKRILIVFGLFFLSPTALAHLPYEASTAGALVSTILIICVTSIAFSFVYDSFFLPTWLKEKSTSRPAFSFAIWSRSWFTYATMIFLALAIITPGACLHNSFDSKHTVGVAVTLMIVFAGFTLIKEFVILKRHKSKEQTIGVVSLVILSLTFSFIFVGIYNTASSASGLFVASWVLWAFVIPSGLVANEASHFYWSKMDETNMAHADGDL